MFWKRRKAERTEADGIVSDVEAAGRERVRRIMLVVFYRGKRIIFWRIVPEDSEGTAETVFPGFMEFVRGGKAVYAVDIGDGHFFIKRDYLDGYYFSDERGLRLGLDVPDILSGGDNFRV